MIYERFSFYFYETNQHSSFVAHWKVELGSWSAKSTWKWPETGVQVDWVTERRGAPSRSLFVTYYDITLIINQNLTPYTMPGVEGDVSSGLRGGGAAAMWRSCGLFKRLNDGLLMAIGFVATLRFVSQRDVPRQPFRLAYFTFNGHPLEREGGGWGMGETVIRASHRNTPPVLPPPLIATKRNERRRRSRSNGWIGAGGWRGGGGGATGTAGSTTKRP